jgi:L-asparaginase
LETPRDSSDIAPLDWIAIARRILDNYAAYDGFVVLHGTDTMAWTAAALSFLLEGLDKPVILTGAQLPLARPLSDAPRNLTAALVLAGTARVPEVCIFFDTLLIRGNRAIKADAGDLHAFLSPNFPPLATVGVGVSVNAALLRQPPRPPDALSRPEQIARRLSALHALEGALHAFSVVAVTLFPGIQQTTMLQVILEETRPPIRGLILGSFGAGDAPLTPAFLATLADAHERGVVIVDGTQVIRGAVTITAYEAGSRLLEAGAISGHDLTPAAALTKLLYLLGLGLDQRAVEQQMQTDLRGEMSAPATPRP